MTAEELLAELVAVGARLSANGDKLHVETPPGAVTPELRAALAEHKAALLLQLGDAPVAPGAQGMSDPRAEAAGETFRIPLERYDEYLRENRLRVVGSTPNGPNGQPVLFLVDDG